MKKLLSLALTIALIALTLSTSALAADDPPTPFDFANLMAEEGTVFVEQTFIGNLAKATLTDGFFFGTTSDSSLDDILSTITLNGIPVFLLNSPTSSTFMWPAAQASEKNKFLKMVQSSGNTWSPAFIMPTSQPIRQTAGSDIIGYTADLSFTLSPGSNYTIMQLYISDDNTVYPIIIAVSDGASDPEPVWREYWPKNNEELTAILREELDTAEAYTFYTVPRFGPKKHTNLLYHAITAVAGEGGSITESGEKLFRPGAIKQKYTITANEGYTIYYVQVDGKTVSNSVNCGDTATFTFDAIYGPRSINAIFKNK